MAKIIKNPVHPGIFVKKNILPEGMTVKKAAEMIGIGRPALSNFLNGKAMLSQDMATRLAKAFNADKSSLLHLQQEYEFFLYQENEKRIAVRSYTPSFLNITATHIDSWADKIEARSLLPAFLRRLVNTTGAEISYSDFPAYDNSQRKGWDGKVESENVTPWIPRGTSVWEFGCSQNPTDKANSDYVTRTNSSLKIDRENRTFIFVTPRNWKSKENWIRERKEENEWKDIRAYDANDLEQWLELSVAGQVWLAEIMGLTQDGCQTLDNYWKFWSETAKPAISNKIFDSAVASHSRVVVDWLQNPAEKPLVITAGSKDEAKAFIACAADKIEELNQFSEQAVLVSNGNIIKRLASTTTEFIPVAYTESVQKELVTHCYNRHAIVITEKISMGVEPDIVVGLPSYESWRNALTEMCFDDAQREIHTSQSGKSPTILRRQLATHPALRKPAWATTNERIQMMIPLVLAGTWKSNQEADKEILRSLANEDYTNIEKNVAKLASIDDAPIWSEDKYRGVVSKLDCFHTISEQIIEDDLSKFFFVAEYILSEDDPALDLEKDERWLANLYDKVREHSDAIRNSICDNLIILSVHGNGLFGNRLGIDLKNHVNQLIRKLLEGQNSRVWQSQQDNLPKYAEAAPDVFLDIIEDELTQENPAFATLYAPIEESIFSHCDRTGMLWALELLAWDPIRLSRVAIILAQLCQYELEDNWVHKPIQSLKDIFLSWKPHTAATIEQRCEVLERVYQEFPDVGWNLCMNELKPYLSSTSGTNRPRWRSDANGSGNGVTELERDVFLKQCRNLVISRTSHNVTTLSDLIDCLVNLDKGEQVKIMKIIEKWRHSSPSDEDILKLREHTRIRTMTQRVQSGINGTSSYANGKKIYDLLEPEQVLLKHQWLFAQHWVEYAPEELEQEDLDYKAREEKISKQRVLALKEIIQKNGIEGVIELCLKGDAGYDIGCHLVENIMNREDVNDYIVKCLSTEHVNDYHRIDSCISGILNCMDNKERQKTLEKILNHFMDDKTDFDKVIRLLISAPFKRTTWNFLQSQKEKIQTAYWEKVNRHWSDHPREDLNFLISQLLDVGRAQAALEFAYLKPDRIESSLLIRVLNEVAINISEPEGYFPLEQYRIEQVFESLNRRDDVKQSDLSKLEYLYIRVLMPFSKYGIPNLSKDISDSPLLFMQLLAMSFRRRDNGEDPEEWSLPTESEQRQNAAVNSYYALDHAKVIPGSKENGTIDIEQLRDWIIRVRALAEKHGRPETGDQMIGQILSKSGTDTDGIWPRLEVRQVVEELASEQVIKGMMIGLYNSNGQGMQSVDASRDQDLAEKYHNFADRVMNKTPFVGRMLQKIAQCYEEDAKRHDTDYRVSSRLDS